MRIQVYGLFDIRKPEEIMYVGQTSDLEKRWRTHQTKRDKTTREWVGKVEKSGGVVAIKILEEANAQTAGSIEQKWIVASPSSINVTNRAPRSMDFHICPIVSLRDMEVQYIRWAIDFFHGNKQAAARALGIGRQTLYSKLRLVE